MVELTAEELKQYFSDDIFKGISEKADELGLECYVVGGYVRDIFLQRPSKDIDVVVVGSGIEMAEALGKRLGDVIRIVEPQESAGYPRYFAAQSNVSSSQAEAYDAFRTIKLNYSMLVRFEIK